MTDTTLVDNALQHIRPNAEWAISDGEVTWYEGDPYTEDELAQAISDAPARMSMKSLRAERDMKLAETDWTQVPDSPLDDATKALWATHRQALRDITNTYSSLDDVVWPTKP
jgi:hypothetical protein